MCSWVCLNSGGLAGVLWPCLLPVCRTVTLCAMYPLHPCLLCDAMTAFVMQDACWCESWAGAGWREVWCHPCPPLMSVSVSWPSDTNNRHQSTGVLSITKLLTRKAVVLLANTNVLKGMGYIPSELTDIWYYIENLNLLCCNGKREPRPVTSLNSVIFQFKCFTSHMSQRLFNPHIHPLSIHLSVLNTIVIHIIIIYYIIEMLTNRVGSCHHLCDNSYNHLIQLYLLFCLRSKK